jgi:PAS domain S-box-containing protein
MFDQSKGEHIQPTGSGKKPLPIHTEDISKLNTEEIQSLIEEINADEVSLELQIEELKRVKEDLKQTRDKFQALRETVPVGYFTIDKELNILEASAAGVKMLGADSLILRWSKITDFVAHNQQSQDIFHMHIRDIFNTGFRKECELEMQRNDGSRFPAIIQIALAETASGQQKQLRIAITDITEQKHTEEFNLNSQRRMLEILESITDGFLVLDRNWKAIYVNRQSASILNFKPEDLIGQNLWEKYPQLIGSELESKYRKAMTERQPQEFDFKIGFTNKLYRVRVVPSKEGITTYWVDITRTNP